MAQRTDLYDSTYGNFGARVLAEIRAETYGTDIGQNSWTTVDEYARFMRDLALDRDRDRDLALDRDRDRDRARDLDLTRDPDLALESVGGGARSAATSGLHVLEIASGSGGPALHLARASGCRITGIDANEHGVATANEAARTAGLGEQLVFQVADANARLPFADASFDGLICIDAANHLLDRRRMLSEWNRVLRPGRRAVFTDATVLRGPVTNAELVTRSSIGLFLFVAPGVNEELIAQAGLRLVRADDTSADAAAVAGRWHRAREARREALLEIEGAERFAGLQEFLRVVERLTGERRLCRIAYAVEAPGK